MDEPTASLDFGNQVMVLAQVQRLAARGIGVIMSTHAPDQAFACADRVLLMQDRRIVAEAGEAVLTAERLREVYGVEVWVSRVPGLERPVCVPRLQPSAPPRRMPRPAHRQLIRSSGRSRISRPIVHSATGAREYRARRGTYDRKLQRKSINVSGRWQFRRK